MIQHGAFCNKVSDTWRILKKQCCVNSFLILLQTEEARVKRATISKNQEEKPNKGKKVNLELNLEQEAEGKHLWSALHLL